MSTPVAASAASDTDVGAGRSAPIDATRNGLLGSARSPAEAGRPRRRRGPLRTAVYCALEQDILFTIVPLLVLIILYLLFKLVGVKYSNDGITSLTPDILFATIILGGIAVSRTSSTRGESKAGMSENGDDDLGIGAMQLKAKHGFRSKLMLVFYLLCIIVLAVGILYSRDLLTFSTTSKSAATPPVTAAPADAAGGEGAGAGSVSVSGSAAAASAGDDRAAASETALQKVKKEQALNSNGGWILFTLSIILLGISLCLVTLTQYQSVLQQQARVSDDPTEAAKQLADVAMRLRDHLDKFAEDVKAHDDLVQRSHVQTQRRYRTARISLDGEVSNLHDCCKAISRELHADA